MKRNFKRIFGLTMMIFMLSTTFVFAAEVESVVSNADRFGLFTLIPPIVAIVLAHGDGYLIAKQVTCFQRI